ncbi:hypothetical protein KI688_002824 [Linnemannia hyalina]|uniref:Uncharacterized protein n=1 Tax=Linnemannia hyalina TaxID=64524 RepID=A0A9P7XP15_9FUNG|nr:hypothetical protein KI688_002824 [Linnemannia hyalina]
MSAWSRTKATPELKEHIFDYVVYRNWNRTLDRLFYAIPSGKVEGYLGGHCGPIFGTESILEFDVIEGVGGVDDSGEEQEIE